MKLLQLLSAAQLIALLYLGWHVMALQPKPSKASAQDFDGEASMQAKQSLSNLHSSTAKGALSHEQWQKLYFDLVAISEKLGDVVTDNDANVARDVAPAIRSTEEEVVTVDQSLEYYLSVGEITPAEMSKLQESIVSLDERNRKEMFKKLFRALNDGRLKGLL